MKHSPTRFPPGPKGRLPTDLLFAFQRDPLQFLSDAAREFGDLVHFQFGPQHVYFLNHPDYVHQVLVTDHRKFTKSRRVRMGKRLTGEGLLTSEGEFHLRQRRLMQPAFHREQIAASADLIANCIREMSGRWNAGETLEIYSEFTRLMLTTHGAALFGADLQADAEEFMQAVASILAMSQRITHPLGELLWKLPLPSNRRFYQARARLDAIVYRLIARRREQNVARDDLLAILLTARDGESESARMTDEQVRDEVMTVLLAGYETTALALTWTCYLLAQHPAVEEKLHRELDSVLAHRAPTVSDLSHLPYLEMIITESLRLYPPSWVISREAQEDYSIGGYVAPAGSTFLISQYVMQRDSRFFPNPERFEPERWTREGIAARPRFSSFPFGAGPRACMGEPFAWLQLKLVTARLAQAWTMRLLPDRRVELEPRITLRPKNGVWMKLERRSSQADKS